MRECESKDGPVQWEWTQSGLDTHTRVYNVSAVSWRTPFLGSWMKGKWTFWQKKVKLIPPVRMASSLLEPKNTQMHLLEHPNPPPTKKTITSRTLLKCSSDPKLHHYPSNLNTLCSGLLLTPAHTSQARLWLPHTWLSSFNNKVLHQAKSQLQWKMED